MEGAKMKMYIDSRISDKAYDYIGKNVNAYFFGKKGFGKTSYLKYLEKTTPNAFYAQAGGHRQIMSSICKKAKIFHKKSESTEELAKRIKFKKPILLLDDFDCLSKTAKKAMLLLDCCIIASASKAIEGFFPINLKALNKNELLYLLENDSKAVNHAKNYSDCSYSSAKSIFELKKRDVKDYNKYFIPNSKRFEFFSKKNMAMLGSFFLGSRYYFYLNREYDKGYYSGIIGFFFKLLSLFFF